MKIITVSEERRSSATGARQVLVTAEDGRTFLVSTIDPNSHLVPVVSRLGETLVFPATPDGCVTDWFEVAGGTGVTREEAIRELESLDEDRPKRRLR